MRVVGDRNEGERKRMRSERSDDRLRVLVRENSEDEVHRPVARQRVCKGGRGLAIVRAVNPCRRLAGQRSWAQALESRRPVASAGMRLRAASGISSAV